MSHKKDYEVEDFAPQINKQIKMLINNCYLYDQGNFEHSLTIASNLRTILHTSGKSKSLIHLTNIQHDYNFYTSQKTAFKTVMCLLLCYTAQIKRNEENHSEFVFLPNFIRDVNDHKGIVKFKKWWNQKIIINNSHRYSRADIILLTANEQGGSHIDKSVNKSFNDLINDIETPLTFFKQSSPQVAPFEAPIKNYVYAAIRQIAHEVLVTFEQIEDLKIDYKPEFNNFKISNDFYLSNLMLTEGSKVEYPEN